MTIRSVIRPMLFIGFVVLGTLSADGSMMKKVHVSGTLIIAEVPCTMLN